MKTIKKRPHQRAHGDAERGFKSCYAQPEADAIFESLEAKIAELEATIESQNHYLEFIHEECRKTARACGAQVSDRTQAGDANVAARQALKKG